jgi:outer membrane receptor protein involved in Fe transport
MNRGLGLVILLGALLLPLSLQGQDRKSRQDRPLRSDFYPKRLDPEERNESGFYGAISYHLVVFEGLGSDIYESGQMIQVEGGYYWERTGVFLSAGVWVSPWGRAFNDDLDAGPPIGLFDAELDFYTAGAVFRLGNGSWPGWHFGLSVGLGVSYFSEDITIQATGAETNTTDQGFLLRGGLFLERDLINSEDLGILLGLVFDYYRTGIDDALDEPIDFWTVGIRLVFSLRPGVAPAREEPQDDD